MNIHEEDKTVCGNVNTEIVVAVTGFEPVTLRI